ncbi:Cthe_2314 family HEPN domain-containing protein [Gorillibacterium timonense]|uniref:Cthe_2314 family HEPN domain-containing protein n=1 Tax=Gorillibacterium timonense TaxID=1689269 RepID=UPI00071CE703|nr:Cthe_2314 family HEPN domain-containing protein [Gorillibacterium timonense]
MLRFLFGEARRLDTGALAEANRWLIAYLAHPTTGERGSSSDKREERKAFKLSVMAKGLYRSLDELEQSLYACRRFGDLVTSSYMEEMDQSEEDDYHRCVYFYKNALIRVFSLLDKLGEFLNERFSLHTEAIKESYSYFTVLRRMKDSRTAPVLEQALFDLKQKHQDPLLRLKKIRNLEIHAINEELTDDLLLVPGTTQTPVEDLKRKLQDLETGYEAACGAVVEVFRYLGKGRG